MRSLLGHYRIFGKTTPLKKKSDIAKLLEDSDKITETKIYAKLGIKRMTKDELLEQMNIKQLRELAKTAGIELEISGTLGIKKRKATTKNEIIKVLSDSISVGKVRSHLTKGAAPVKRVIKREAVMEEEHIKERITEREIHRRKATVSEVDYTRVLDELRKINFHKPKGRKYEEDYEIQLYQRLDALFPNVRYERYGGRRSRFDITVGNDIAIELKRVRGTCQGVRTLSYQIGKYRERYNIIAVVLINEGARPDILNEEMELLKKHHEPIEIIVKDASVFC